MHKKTLSIILAFSLAASALALTGCGSGPASSSQGVQYTYKDQVITLQAQPKRVVTLTAPLLNMAYAVGGTSLAKPTTTSPIPDAAKDLPELGQIAHINMEELIQLKPDLVIGEKSQNSKLTDQLKSNNIPYLMINYDGLDDNVDVLRFMGEVYGTKDKTEKLVSNYENQMKDIENRAAEAAKKKPVTVAVLRATGRGVTMETPRSICASMTEKLHMDNVISHHKDADLRDAKTVPYSLEQLSADDPDIIFIVTMGKAEEINASLDKNMRDNPAWSSLSAVRNNHVYTLESDLYLMNPGLRAPEAMEKLYKIAYEQ